MGTKCPLCNASGWRYRTSMWAKDKPNSSWAHHGGGSALCNKCVKTRQDEIIIHNNKYRTPAGSKKDTDCQHEWVHPYPGRWYCTKCSATYNWMCGCGSSMYVCKKCYDDFIKRATKEHGSIEKFLSTKSW